jgi:adenine-specific DNA-methyltransferase
MASLFGSHQRGEKLSCADFFVMSKSELLMAKKLTTKKSKMPPIAAKKASIVRPPSVSVRRTGKRPIEQYEHKDKTRVNNPPVGLVTPETDKDAGKKTYAYDPHLDPQLVWAGKAERTSFEVPTVSLHVHERIDPRTIIEAVRKKNGSNYEQLSLFSSKEENPPVRDAVDFYKHPHNWSNRLIAGDSLLVMNSLIEKEGLGGQVQMIYFDPPYGIKYGSNFQPFVNKRDVKDGKDEDLTQEPEMIKAFRDTWELGIHSYLAYLRDRLLLAKELLHESGSVFLQISDENVHHVREICDEIFGNKNFVALIAFQKTISSSSKTLPIVSDYLVWFAKNIDLIKYRQLFSDKRSGVGIKEYQWIESPDGKTKRKLSQEEQDNLDKIPDGWKLFRQSDLTSQGWYEERGFKFEFNGEYYSPGSGRHWSISKEGLQRLTKMGRLIKRGSSLAYARYFDDQPVFPLSNNWNDVAFSSRSEEKVYVVQTSEKPITRCMLMTSDPGDIVFDPTCGSGTTAFVAENWGRRWITCDTSRVAVTLAKQRLMTATFDYFELAHSDEGVGSGFRYRTVPHITLKSIANNEPPGQETLYDQPFVDTSKVRVTGPFTVEAVPAPVVKPLTPSTSPVPTEVGTPPSPAHKSGTQGGYAVGNEIARSGETLRQSDWRDELLRTGIRGKNKQFITFSRLEPLPGTRYLHAIGEIQKNDRGANTVKEPDSALYQVGTSPVPTKNIGTPPSPTHNPALQAGHAERVVVSFGPDHAPLEQRQVALAIDEAQTLVPKPKVVVFAAFQFDPEAAKDIDETNWPGVTLLKVQMNPDLLTEDLKKARSSNESFWLIGQPDVRVDGEQWLVDSNERRIGLYGDIKKLSGIDSLAEINGLDKTDILLYAIISERGNLWADLTNSKGERLHSGEHSGRAGKEQYGRVRSVFGDSEGIVGRIGNALDALKRSEFSRGGKIKDFITAMRRDKQTIERLKEITLHSPLTTRHSFTVTVEGFDYYNTKTGQIESGGAERIAVWMLDTDYDGRALFPRQVFFPMSGENEGWTRLAKNLKAEIDEELIEAYRGNVSVPFEIGSYKQIAVKIVDDRGIESLKVVKVG